MSDIFRKDDVVYDLAFGEGVVDWIHDHEIEYAVRVKFTNGMSRDFSKGGCINNLVNRTLYRGTKEQVVGDFKPVDAPRKIKRYVNLYMINQGDIRVSDTYETREIATCEPDGVYLRIATAIEIELDE